MVGDVATTIHGFQRFEGILQIWIKDDKENRQNLENAMKIFGYEDLSWEEIQFIPGWTNFYISNGIVLDILISMKGLEGFSFDKCFQLATIAEIENIKIPFLHINHLIANKKAVNRPKDQIDVIELEKLSRFVKKWAWISDNVLYKILFFVALIYPLNTYLCAKIKALHGFKMHQNFTGSGFRYFFNHFFD